jgi:hypothetical protein
VVPVTIVPHGFVLGPRAPDTCARALGTSTSGTADERYAEVGYEAHPAFDAQGDPSQLEARHEPRIALGQRRASRVGSDAIATTFLGLSGVLFMFALAVHASGRSGSHGAGTFAAYSAVAGLRLLMAVALPLLPQPWAPAAARGSLCWAVSRPPTQRKQAKWPWSDRIRAGTRCSDVPRVRPTR